jgi:hypothetical protein
MMGDAAYIDPIEHAWRHCNPHSPLPPALVQRAGPSGVTFKLHSSDGQLVAEWSGTRQDVQDGFFTIATLPRISPPIAD